MWIITGEDYIQPLLLMDALLDNFFNDLRHVDYQTYSAQSPGSYALNSNLVPSEQYPVYFTNVNPVYSSQPFWKAFQGYGDQLSNNFGQQVGLQLNIPIFNGNSQRTNYKKAQLNVASAKLTKENDLLTLKQNIYQAYYNAVASMQKYEANKKAVVRC